MTIRHAPCRFGGLLSKALSASSVNKNGPMGTIEEDDELTKEQFTKLLEKVDSGLRALPATAQVCVIIQWWFMVAMFLHQRCLAIAFRALVSVYS